MQRLPYPDPGVPDLRTPLRFLRWVARGQWRTLSWGVLFGVIWMVSQALFPAAVGQAIDVGIIAKDRQALMVWGGVLVGLGAVGALAGAMRHRFAVENWLRASFRCMQLIGYKAADTGEALPRRMPTGEVVATVASDSMRLGGLYDVSARFAGAIVSYVVVAVILLSKSRPLGLVVLIGVPVLVSALSFILRPLQRRQAEQREQSGKLITLGADTVAGLRVLRGIGGEQQFLRRYQEQSQRVRVVGVRVAGIQASLDAAQVLLPGVFVVLVTWLGARFALDGTITPGDLVQFYGYAAFLVMPLRTATEFADRATRAHIAARKIIRVLSTEPDTKDATRKATVEPPHGVPLTDPASNVTIAPGQLTAIVSARPEESRALADRLGRFGKTRTDVHLDGVAIADLPLATVRRRIVVSEIDPRLFTGSLREELDPHGIHDDEAILSALMVASGEDVMEALPSGLDSDVEERGRSFSGGQRQRLALTRALLTNAEMLVLVEPTSAVDTHTEARIAVRLASARAGRTTVVMTSSPLMLDQADAVILLTNGMAAARGTHKELMATSPAYKDTVVRGGAT
ncbi:MAG: ABC transporter ATP-binding protein [Phycicoccus sp.]|nr:ABC transporter ATP-binding protein [Phycicoccus sp.]NMM33964.1 ABC transporter ATP-binding protein [Phycicoccus sp.]